LADVPGFSDAHLAPLAGELRPPRTYSVDQGKLSSSVLQEAGDTYAHLDEQATV
jgi:hypothetical protein